MIAISLISSTYWTYIFLASIFLITPKPNFLCFTLSSILKPNVSSTFFTSSGITIVFFVFISVFFFSNLLVFSGCLVSEKSLFLKEIPEKLLDIDIKKERLYFVDDYSDEIKTYGNNKKFEKKKTEINTKNTIKLDDNAKKVIDNLGFKIGDKVKHKKFGLGVIKSIDAKKIYVQYVDGTKEMAVILADKLLTKFE